MKINMTYSLIRLGLRTFGGRVNEKTAQQHHNADKHHEDTVPLCLAVARRLLQGRKKISGSNAGMHGHGCPPVIAALKQFALTPTPILSMRHSVFAGRS